MGDVAASGAYYATAGSDWIVAHPTTITGSIGVVMMNFDATVLLQKIGVQDNPIKSGPYKDMGSWTRPMTPEERQLLQDLIDEMLGRFVKVVADGRKLSPEKVKALADGRIFSATQAKAAGLVDQIGYHQDALQKVKELAKLKQAKVVRYDKAFSFASFFEAEAEGVLKRPFSLDGLVRDLAYPRGPRLMYLWTGR
jgi:protease-4